MNNILDKFIKNKNNKYIYIIIIIGVVVMILSAGIKKKPDIQQSVTNDSYSEEKRLETIISDIKGAGAVSVMITYYESVEKDFAYDVKSSRSAKDSGASTENIDKQAVKNSGEPIVVKEVYPDVKGVVITAEGAGMPAVKNNISEAVQSALGVAPHKISIFEKRTR